MTNKTYKIIILAVAILAVGGYVAALNGWFGGGGTIPEDTMTRGLVGYWSMDEGAGQTAFDASGNSNNGRLGSSASADTADPKWTKGKNGGGLVFDGKNDYVDAGAGSSLNLQTMSIEAWFNSNELSNGHLIFSKSYSTNRSSISFGTRTNNILYWLLLDQDGTTGKGFGSGAGTKQTTAGLVTNKWYHMVGTYDGDIMRIYLNGALLDTTNITDNAIPYSSNTSYIGVNYYAFGGGLSSFFNGSIDDVRIYNRALSAEEVRYHYNRGGPVAEWKFDEGSGTKAFDSTENNNNGTLTNFGSADTGTATSATNNTLTQTGKTWTVNQWANGTINITAGTGIGQTRTISSNTADTITVSSNWTTNPVAGSTYSLAQAPSFTTGKYGSAIQFDGKDDYVSIPYTNIGGTLTYSLWTKSPTAGGGYRVFSYMGTLIQLSGNQIRFYPNVQSGASTAKSYTLNSDVWYYITITHIGTTTEIFVNGVSLVSAIDQVINTSSYSNRIGRYGDNYYTGSIDEVRIYNYARAADEIRLDYQAGYATHFGPSGKTCSEDPASCMDYGLVGNWGMDEGSGQTAFDASDSKNNGTLGSSSSADTNDPKWTKGKNGGGLKFDGVNDYVSLPVIPSITSSNSYSISGWFNALNITVTTRNIFTHTISTTDKMAISIFNSQLRTVHYNGANTAVKSGVISTNTWYYFVYVHDNSTGIAVGTLYINNIIQTGGSSGSTSNIVGGLIGTIQTTYGGFDGSIDEVRIYNRALSAEEVRYHYNRGGPVAEWKFDEGSGQKAYDSEGNADGTLGSDSLPVGDVNDPGWSVP